MAMPISQLFVSALRVLRRELAGRNLFAVPRMSDVSGLALHSVLYFGAFVQGLVAIGSTCCE
jgi:hypothetical protein